MADDLGCSRKKYLTVDSWLWPIVAAQVEEHVGGDRDQFQAQTNSSTISPAPATSISPAMVSSSEPTYSEVPPVPVGGDSSRPIVLKVGLHRRLESPPTERERPKRQQHQPSRRSPAPATARCEVQRVQVERPASRSRVHAAPTGSTAASATAPDRRSSSTSRSAVSENAPPM